MSDSLAGPEWVSVFEGTSLEADVYRAALDAAGFTVFSLGAQSPYPGLAFEAGSVLVAADQAEEAREFLRQAAEQQLPPSPGGETSGEA